MPKTRAKRGAAESGLLVLPPDVLSHIVYFLQFAHDIARIAPTCHVVSVAVRDAFKARPHTGGVLTLRGHTLAIWGVVAAHDDHVLAGSDDHKVKVWRGDELVRTIELHTSYVWALAALPGGTRFISGSHDGTAKLFTFDGELERTFEVGSEVQCVAVLPGGTHFVVGLGDGPNRGEFRLYRVDGTLVHTFKGHTSGVMALAVTRDGQHIISSSMDHCVKVWSVWSKSLLSTCGEEYNGDEDIGHTDQVFAVAVMPDGQRILSGGADNTVRVWLPDGTLKNTFNLHTDEVWAVVALPDNQHALSGSVDQTVKLFNVNDGSVLRTFKHHTDLVTSLALLPDGLRFVSGSADHTARIVEIGPLP